jgi:hypothetical protein
MHFSGMALGVLDTIIEGVALALVAAITDWPGLISKHLVSPL